MSASSPVSTKTPLLSDRTYTVLKYVAMIVLPAAGTLYFALASLWDLPNAEKVVGTIAAVNAFIGLLTGVSTSTYNRSDAKYDGTLNLVKQADGSLPALSVELNQHPVTLTGQDAATFKVNVSQEK